MKRISALIIVAALGSSAAVGFGVAPAMAARPYVGGLIPQQCALPDTKTKHPDWYRDGGYCTIADGAYIAHPPHANPPV